MDSKMDDSDSEYETEEAVVLVELNGIIDSNFLHEEQNPCKILGIETDEPILQLGHYIFSGEYEDTMGTVVVYEPVQVQRSDGQVDTDFQFLCKTDKKLSMKRVFLQEKKSVRINEPTPVELANTPLKSSVISTEHSQKLTNGKHPDNMTQVIKENFSSFQNDIRSVCVQSSECSVEPSVANSEIASKNEHMLEELSFQENSESDSNITALITEIVNTVSSSTNLERLEDQNSDLNCSKMKLAENNIVTETESSEFIKDISSKNEKDKGKISKKRKYTEIDSEVKKTVQMMMKKVTSSKNINPMDKKKKKVSKASFTYKNGGKYSSEKIKGIDIPNKSDVLAFQEEKLPSKYGIVSSNDSASCVSFQESTNSNKYHSISKLGSSKKLSRKTVDLINQISSNSDDGVNSLNITNEQVNQKPVLNTDSEDNVNQLVQSSTDKVVEHTPFASSDGILEERDEKCTSSADMNYTDSSDVLNPCQSSELKQIGNERNNNTTFSLHKKGKNRNTNQTLTGKVTLCEVSQSATNYDPDRKDLQECEIHKQSHSDLESCDSISHIVADPCASSTESEVSAKSKMLVRSKTGNTNAAKVSSCEVTQSNNSGKISLKNSENTNECEASVKDCSLDNGAENFYQSAKELRMQGVRFGGSLVEVSQSDKECETQKFKSSLKNIKESLRKGMVCSQSSDSSYTFSREINVDPCVSSCDTKKHSLDEEVPASSSEDETLSTSCEVSQSGKIENLLTENENKREFNECSQSVNSAASASNSVASETEYFHTNIPSHSKIFTSAKGKASKDTSCEVSQSFKSDSLNPSLLKQENLKFAGNSSECEVFVKNYHSGSSDVRTNSADDSYISTENMFSDSLYVSANSMPNPCEVSQSSSCESDLDLTSKTHKSRHDKISTNECEVFKSNSFKRSLHDSNMSSKGKKILKRPVCEVSQSVASKERLNKVENSGVLGHKARGKASGELGNNCEVSQSLNSEQRMFESIDTNITASKIDIASGSTSHFSNEYEEEMECESSDDISDDTWNVKHRNKDLTSEVSQSYRSQFRDNSLPHSSELISVDVEDSSECEVYGQRSLDTSLEQDSNQVKSCVKEICGSSEDVESFRGKYTSFNLKSKCKSSTNEISQSVKYGKSRLNTFSLYKDNSINECDISGQDGNNITSEVARDVCESSEDVHISNPIVSFPDECTSSIRDTRAFTNESKHLPKVCDSLSNAGTTLLVNETENYNISQSGSQTINDDIASVGENNLSLDSSNVALDSVNVSSSVDSLSSNYIDSIYSSSVLLNSSQNYVSVSSVNSEVTQSCTKGSSQHREENTEALNKGNSSACLIASETDDEVSQPVEFSGVQSSDDLELTCLTLPNDQVNVLESSFALNKCKSLSVDEPGTSSSTAHSFQDDFSGLELVESSTATYPVPRKKETELAENKNSIAEGQDIKDAHRHIEILRCTSNVSNENDEQKLNILGMSESQASGQPILRDNLDHSDIDQLSEQQPSKTVSSSKAKKQLSGSRPSLLEVIVSSASDFRNSLIHEGNNFVRKKSQHSSPGQPVESSSSNIEATNGYSESFNEAIGYSSELDNQENKSFQAGTDPLKDQVNEYPDSEVSGSFEQIHRDSILDEQNNSQHQVSQSSEIVNTHSSTSKVHILPSDITESSQQDFVQSSTSISRVSGCVTLKDSSLNSEQVSSAEESILTSNLDISEVCESSSAQDVLMPGNKNTPVASNSENRRNVTESSKYPANYKTISQVENTESEVSSSPCDTHYSALDVISSVDGSGQCSVVEGNIVIEGKFYGELSKPNDLPYDAAAAVVNLEASCSNISSNSNALQRLPCGSSYVKENEITELHEDRISSFNVICSTNEAKGLIQGTSSSSVTELGHREDSIQLHSSQNEGDLSSSDVIFEADVSNSPLNEVEIVADVYECDESSASCEMQNNSSLCEVTESHAVSMNDLLESSPDENKVSCSVSEISLSNQTFYKNYGFNENEFCQLSSHEAIAKSPDNCESSYEVNVCDNVLTMQSISRSASENEELSMYSHGADFENDSVQSSSFESPFSVSEQIKVISSPTFTDASCFEVQAPLTSNSFMTLPSETQFLAPDQCDISLNKLTSSSSPSMCTSEVTQSSPEDSVIVSNYSTFKDRQSSPSTSSSHNIIHETDSSQLDALETEDNLYLDNNCTSNNSSHLCTNENEDYWSQQTHFDCTEEIISESHSDVCNLADSTEDGTDMATSDADAKL